MWTPAFVQHEIGEIIRRVQAGQPVESSHIELKSKWIEPTRAARSIAAMCNAAGLEPVWFIVGVDEKGDVPGAPPDELSRWLAQVQGEFDRDYPALIINTTFRYSDTATVVALVFRSSNAPFVIKNPVGGGHISLEVPWREGNSNRTARREDLLRILVPAAGVPELEVLGGELRFLPGSDPSYNGCWAMELWLELFATVRRPATLIAHKTCLAFDPANLGPPNGARLDFRLQEEHPGAPQSRSVSLVQPAAFRFLASGPTAYGGAGFRGADPYLPNPITLALDFHIDRATNRTAPLAITFHRRLRAAGSSSSDQYPEYIPELPKPS